MKRLLSANILLRWGNWFVRDLAVLYVVGMPGTAWFWLRVKCELEALS